MVDKVNLVVVLDKHAYRYVDGNIQSYAWMSVYNRLENDTLYNISSLLVDINTSPFKTSGRFLLPEDPDVYYRDYSLLKGLYYEAKYNSYLENSTVKSVEIVELPTWVSNAPIIFDMLQERRNASCEYVPTIEWEVRYGSELAPFEDDVKVLARRLFTDPVAWVSNIIPK